MGIGGDCPKFDTVLTVHSTRILEHPLYVVKGRSVSFNWVLELHWYKVFPTQ